MTPILEARGIAKAYAVGSARVPVLADASLSVSRGELLCIVGQSGSGKSTLLHLLGLLDRPDSGEVLFDGQGAWGDQAGKSRPGQGSSAWANRLRNQRIGFVFQFYHLLPELTLMENVLLPVMVGSPAWAFAGRRAECRHRAQALLERMGLGHRLKHVPSQLSGGERQRGAIARALLPQPDVLLADEPTGNLDRATGQGVLDALVALNQELGQTVVMVTHDEHVASRASRVVRLADGRVVPEATA